MLTLFHDYTSPYSAVAVWRLQRLAGEGVPVAFVGFEAIGVDAYLPVTVDLTAGLHDLADVAKAEGLTLQRPANLPPTALAHVVGELADERGLGRAWRRTCYQAYWQEGADLADTGVLTERASAVGLDAHEVASWLHDRGRVVAFRRGLARHRQEGVGGVPTILAHRTLVPGLLGDDDLRALADL